MQHISKVKPEKKVQKVVVLKKLDDGLDQIFTLKNGKSVSIRKFLKPEDMWVTNGRRKATIISHNGIKKMADAAGVSKAPEYKVLTQPDAMNNYQMTIEAKVCMLKDKNDCAVELGESNRSNLGSRGRGNPANMAEKRAYDRAVLRLLGIEGILSEEELQDEEEEKMDKLNHADRRKIAPLINQLLLAKTNAEMAIFNKEMKVRPPELTEEQLDYLRKLYRKRMGEISKFGF